MIKGTNYRIMITERNKSENNAEPFEEDRDLIIDFVLVSHHYMCYPFPIVLGFKDEI